MEDRKLRANPNLQLHGGTKLTVGGREGRHICAMEAARRIVGVSEHEDAYYEETGRHVGLNTNKSESGGHERWEARGGPPQFSRDRRRGRDMAG